MTCLNCGKRFRHYNINFKPEPMYNKMYQFIPVVMCAWCRHRIAERRRKKLNDEVRTLETLYYWQEFSEDSIIKE